MSSDSLTTTDYEIDVEKAREGTRLLLEAVGQDPFAETWQRRVPEALATLTAGSRQAEKPQMRTFDVKTSDLVIKSGIPFYSL